MMKADLDGCCGAAHPSDSHQHKALVDGAPGVDEFMQLRRRPQHGVRVHEGQAGHSGDGLPSPGVP